MRKINCLLAILIAVVLTSCGGEGNPVIFVKTQGAVTPDFENAEAVVLEGNVTAEAVLTKVVFTTKFEDGSSTELTVDQFTNNLNYEFGFTTELLGITLEGQKAISVSIHAVDANNNTDSKDIEVTYAETPATELTKAAFEWQRVGGGDANGLETFGLQWVKNQKEVMCVITPMENTKLVELTEEDWGVTTVEELATAIDAATAIEMFNKVSAEANADYDYYIGTVTAEGNYYIINITKGDVAVSQAGTTITITGEEKH